VAVVVLLVGTAGGSFAAGLAGPGRAGMVLASAGGAALVLALVLTLARWTRSVATLLIIGVMVGSVVTSLVSLMLSVADAEQARRYILWGLGSFSGTGWTDLAWFAPVALLGIAAALALAKPLNALLLGETYAQTMGVNVRTVRRLVIVTGAVLAGTVTAFCGPVAFLGLAIPHLARVAVGSAEHRVLLPTAVLMGGFVAVLCGTAASLPGTGAALPLNVVTSVIGGPIVVAALLPSRAAEQGVGP
jgi:iron complex transport system permease protein